MQFSIVPYLPQVAFVDIELFVDSANLSALKQDEAEILYLLAQHKLFILFERRIFVKLKFFLREAVTSLRQFIRSRACGGG